MNYRLIDHTINPITHTYLVDLYEMTNGGIETIYVCAPTGGIGITMLLSGQTEILVEDTWERTAPYTVYGLIRKAQSIKMIGDYREITIGFKPQILQLLLKERLFDLPINTANDLFDVLDRQKIEPLAEGLLRANTDEEVVQTIGAFILDTMQKQHCDSRISEAYTCIMNGSFTNIESLSRHLNISSTMLRMLFRDQLGVSPKELVQFSRIKRALNLRIDTAGSLTSIGYEADYFDQSHFIRDFKKTMGMVPKQYYQNNDLTFDFYNFGRWRLSSFERKVSKEHEQISLTAAVAPAHPFTVCAG